MERLSNIQKPNRSHVIGQVVFFKRMRLKAMWRCIEVITPNTTYKAFGLEKQCKA